VIATSGGPDGGRALALNHPVHGNLEAPNLTVKSDRFLLENEECAAGPDGQYAFYDNGYSWALTGSTLTVATVTNNCPDPRCGDNPHEPSLDEATLTRTSGWRTGCDRREREQKVRVDWQA
jgi:hypothetical protein